MSEYNVNYDDERFQEVESDKNEALSELEETYSEMIENSDSYYQGQMDAAEDWADKQTQLQQEQTDFAIEQINQQKDQAHKDYIKEQSGAYADWQKQSNQYGTNAEQMASAGLTGTGFSESSQVSMYNTYQNRVATARESFNRAVLNYDNAIKDARLQNNAALAEIAYQALQTQLELSLQGFQYKNNLILEQANKKLEVDQMYHQRYQDVLAQINHENAMAEEIRQYNQNYELQLKQYQESIRQFDQNYDLKLKEYNESIRQFEVELERLKQKDAKEYELEIQRLELEKQKMEEAKRQFEEEMKLKREQLSGSRGGGGGGGGEGYIPQTANLPNGTTKENKATMQSVLDLGKGPLSAESVANMVASGQVVQTTDSGGNVVFKPSGVTTIPKPAGWTAVGSAIGGATGKKTQSSTKKEEKKWWQFWK